MANFSRELDDGDWFLARVAGISTALKNMDAKTVKAGNGEAGSTHTPGTEILVAGAGMGIAGEWTLDGNILTGPGAHIQHGGKAAGDYLRLGAGHPLRVRTIDQTVLPSAPDGYLYAFSPGDNVFAVNSRYPGVRQLIRIEPHDGSTLDTVQLQFAIRFTHTSFPTLPKFRVIRTDSSGNAEPLHTARSAPFYGDDGFIPIASPANVTAYNNGGNRQLSNIFSTNQNSLVDISKYAYWVDFIEETGPSGVAFTPNVDFVGGSGTELFNIRMFCSGINHLGPQ